MDPTSTIKLIELLSLKPGSFLYPNAVTGEPVCKENQSLYQLSDWQEEISHAAFPGSSPVKVQNFQKLLDIPIEVQLVVHHRGDNVVEMLRFNAAVWSVLQSKEGREISILSDGKAIASGWVERHENVTGIRIQKIYHWRNKMHCT